MYLVGYRQGVGSYHYCYGNYDTACCTVWHESCLYLWRRFYDRAERYQRRHGVDRVRDVDKLHRDTCSYRNLRQWRSYFGGAASRR